MTLVGLCEMHVGLVRIRLQTDSFFEVVLCLSEVPEEQMPTRERFKVSRSTRTKGAAVNENRVMDVFIVRLAVECFAEILVGGRELSQLCLCPTAEQMSPFKVLLADAGV